MLLIAHPCTSRVQITLMSTHIKNVQVGKSLVDDRLASTGVHSCIAVVIWSEDTSTFIYHIDPLNFNVEAKDPRKECIKVIRMTMKKYKERRDSSFKEIFIVGGLKNTKFERLHTELNLLSKNHFALANHGAEPIDEDVQVFCQSLKYVNLMMNVDGETDDEEVTTATFITDLPRSKKTASETILTDHETVNTVMITRRNPSSLIT